MLPINLKWTSFQLLLFLALSAVLAVDGSAQEQMPAKRQRDFNSLSDAAEQAQRRLPQPDDRLAYVRVANGSGIANLQVSLHVLRTVGFFSGSGTPPITPRTPSNAIGELRFPADDNLQQWIVNEVRAQQPGRDSVELSRQELQAFKGYRWTVNGYWPATNSRIELTSVGSPALWMDEQSINFEIPQLYPVSISVTSSEDGLALANVRVRVSREFDGSTEKLVWIGVDAYAWSNAHGVAAVWLPTGNYKVQWDTTVASVGVRGPRQEPNEHVQPPFGMYQEPAPPRNAMGDQARRQALATRSFWWNDDQRTLEIKGAAPTMYELKLKPPLVVVP